MNPDWTYALLGGAFIGLSASLMLFLSGQVAGVSGIVYALLTPSKKDIGWRIAFVVGLISAGFLLHTLRPEIFSGQVDTEDWTLILSGLLVGFGTVLGSGCTSGHGVCGISRLSVRSIVATVIFICAGIISVFLFRGLGVIP